jgi:hypothetical protein
MKNLKRKLTDDNYNKYYLAGKRYLNDPVLWQVVEKSLNEIHKSTLRTEVLNFLLSQLKRETTYLEIGVCDPSNNYNYINADIKYSVDPGYDFIKNPVDFKMNSDEFFSKLDKNEILTDNIKFDVIFIDGLHLAEQVDRDIINSLKYIKDDGFIVLHDCNPPTEWHAREDNDYFNTPAGAYWNGSTWKAFVKWRFSNSVKTCCIDSDFGIGVLSKKHSIGNCINPSNLFFEFNVFDKYRIEYLNLMNYSNFKNMIIEILSPT